MLTGTGRVCYNVSMPQQPLLYPDAAQRFLKESGKLRTKTSREAYLIKLRQLQQQHPGKRLKAFKAADLSAFCFSGDPAPATINNRKSTLSSFFGWARYVGMIDTDPSLDLKFTVKAGRFGVRQHTWLTVDQARRLVHSMPTETFKDRRDRALVFTGLMTGLRVSGLVGLRWSSFSKNMDTIKLKVKGGKLMEIAVPDELRPVLMDWRRELAKEQGKDGPVFPAFHYGYDPEGGYLMSCAYHNPVGAAGARAIVKKAGADVGMELRPHDLRRSFANVLEESGFDIQDISVALGHENISTTSVYMDKNPHRVLAVGRKLRIDL